MSAAVSACSVIAYPFRVVVQFQKTVSRKGAKAQRKARKEQTALNSLACFLCAFAGDSFVMLI
jgi:hypothetical protein